jgi:hypothetical protein
MFNFFPSFLLRSLGEDSCKTQEKPDSWRERERDSDEKGHCSLNLRNLHTRSLSKTREGEILTVFGEGTPQLLLTKHVALLSSTAKDNDIW